MLQNEEIMSKEMLEGFYFETGRFELNINSYILSLSLSCSHQDALSLTEIWPHMI